jgi:hypothetical protein
MIRQVLAGARPQQLDIAGKPVDLSVEEGDQPAWPSADIPGLEAAEDGPWPKPVKVTCTWEGGSVQLWVKAEFWTPNNRERHNLCAVSVTLVDHARALVWITIGPKAERGEDGGTITVDASIALVKPSKLSKTMPGWAQALKDVVADSGLPMITASRVEVFQAEIPGCTILPSPEAAFRRLLRVALFKLDFFDAKYTTQRGAPLVVVPPRVGVVGGDDEEDEDDTELESEDAQRQYWAGGFSWSEGSKLDEFVAGSFWQIGWDKEALQRAAKTTWKRFARIGVGDWFAIKGYGGKHDLKIYYVGEVQSVNHDTGRVDMAPVDAKLFNGKAPRGAGAGNWQETLVPVTLHSAIANIFGVQDLPVNEVHYPPLNLILYGPPGTGKTYKLQNEYIPTFTRTATTARRQQETLEEFLAGLTWFEAAMLGLRALGGEASVSELENHRYLALKYASISAKTPLRSFLWGVLQSHTVEESTTVHLSQRRAIKVFDKGEDSRWFFAGGTPAIADELAERLAEVEHKKAATDEKSSDHTFVTFHQSYAYEDFVEGIRPRVDQSEEDGGIGYVLEDGVFKRAVRAALRLAGFEGSIDAFCALSTEERANTLEGAPHHAIFIDEINRGNVANIFGELITLLEDDKRLGEANEIVLTLPYSKTRFGVPSNLHVIGTMNTADRSIEALDTALRRRFAFDECMPRYDVLDFEISGGIDPAKLLRTINARLHKLYDRDHTIGHAYFLRLEADPSLEALKESFQRQVLPLLQEYFFNDWGQIGLILGKEFIHRVDRETSFADAAHEELDNLRDRPVYELADIAHLTSASFRRIYEDVTDDD